MNVQADGRTIDGWMHMIPGDSWELPKYLPIPTNQEARGYKLDRTIQLTFCGSRGHLESFSGDFFGVNLFTRMCFKYLL